MKEITTNKLQNDLSKVIREVENGEVFQITRYSKSVAYLVSKEEFEKLVAGTECKACMKDLRKIADKLNQE